MTESLGSVWEIMSILILPELRLCKGKQQGKINQKSQCPGCGRPQLASKGKMENH